MLLDINLSDLQNTTYLNVTNLEMYVDKSDILKIPELQKIIDLKMFNDGDKVYIEKYPFVKQKEIVFKIMQYYNVMVYKNDTYYFIKDTLVNIIGHMYILNKICTNKPTIEYMNESLVSVAEFSENELLLIFRGYLHTILRVENHTPISIKQTLYLKDISYKLFTYTKITDIQQFVLKQYEIYLSTQLGTIPFNNGFGSIIKQLLMKKDIGNMADMIYDEIKMFTYMLNNIYENDKSFSVKVNDVKTISENNGFSKVVTIEVYLLINNESFNFAIETGGLDALG